MPNDNEIYSFNDITNILSISKSVINSWVACGKLKPINPEEKEHWLFKKQQLMKFEEFKAMDRSSWEQELKIKPLRKFSSVELFAGAGGLALGLESAGFEAILLNEIDKNACNTLKNNRPNWNVLHENISNLDFSFLKNKIDFLSGGFPCQAFSYAGNKLGFDDTRGTLFFEFARAVKEIQPKVFLGENVKGLLKHENGKTLLTITNVLKDLGYTLIEPRVLKAIFYKVPQKRERLFIIGIRNDLFEKYQFSWPSPYKRIMTLKDALYKGELFDSDVPESIGQKYPQRKKEIIDKIPQGGYWKDLPDNLQKEYMQKSFFLGGGKTGMARRLSLDEPSLTLTCAPAQKQTERCHPLETRPLTIREYARIQTFPDSWTFSGSLASQYKQIGNAVPVNLAAAVGRSLIRLLNIIETNSNEILYKPNITISNENHKQLLFILNQEVESYISKYNEKK